MAATFESFEHPLPVSLSRPRSPGSVGPQPRLYTWMLRVVCCTALGVTGYLALTALRSEDVAGCGGGAFWDCGYALHSRWSKIFGVPVSIPAFALYAVILTSLAFCRPTARRSRVRLAWGITTVGAILAGLAAVWFISLQLLAVGHVCVYCMAAHGCGLALALSILWRRPLGARTTTLLASFSAFAVSVLIAGQAFATPPATFKIEHYAVDLPATTPSASTTSETGSKRPVAIQAPKVFEAPAAPPGADEN
jgi:uncharacterized membrane protein